jgi:hypothetical protein
MSRLVCVVVREISLRWSVVRDSRFAAEMSAPAANEKCVVCSKTAYPLEAVVLQGLLKMLDFPSMRLSCRSIRSTFRVAARFCCVCFF